MQVYVCVSTALMPKSGERWEKSEEETSEKNLERCLGGCLMNKEGKGMLYEGSEER